MLRLLPAIASSRIFIFQVHSTSFVQNPLSMFSLQILRFPCGSAEWKWSLCSSSRAIDAGSRVECPRNINRLKNRYYYVMSPRGLTFTWWGCCGLCFFNINQPGLPTPFYLVLVFFSFISVFMALSAVFNFTNSPNNSPLSHLFLPVLFLPIGPFDYISLHESLL